MRPTYRVPQDDGSRRSHRCPPSHHEMALTPEYAQASARAPRPSQPLTGSPMSSAPVSPYHQQGSTMPSAAPAKFILSPPRALREHGGGKSPHAAARLLVWVDGTLAHYHRGDNAIAELGPSFLADSVFSHPPSTNDGGECRLGGMPCFGTQSPAFGIHHVKHPGFVDANP
jgi:hypothetical protein